MEPDTMGARLQEFSKPQQDGRALTATELQTMLDKLNGLASAVHDLQNGDVQSTTAKIDQLRRQITQWYDAAVAQELTSQAVQTLPALEDEYCTDRDRWLAADAESVEREALEANMIACLAKVEEHPDSEQLASHIRGFLVTTAGVVGI